jgi:hypothetical protein
MFTQYTSPFTGKVYEVTTRTHTRAVGNWYNNEPLRQVEVTEYIFSDGANRKFTTFDLDENHLKSTVGEIEGIFGGWATSARD